jgi:hypothetical protein
MSENAIKQGEVAEFRPTPGTGFDEAYGRACLVLRKVVREGLAPSPGAGGSLTAGRRYIIRYIVEFIHEGKRTVWSDCRRTHLHHLHVLEQLARLGELPEPEEGAENG